MATKARRHIHKYHVLNIGYADVWACALPNCNHYMPQHMEAIVLGKGSICWGCGEQFILDTDAMKAKKPYCFNCRTSTSPTEEVAPMSDVLKQFLDKLDQ